MLPDARLERAYLIRLVEEQLLRLFSEGKVAGTTHTCIGQELSAVVLAESLDPDRDLIFSNHRCHGHYIAWTDDVEGLLAEVMGREIGVCAGIGGSQHLCGRRFFSNGIQGGITPVSAGLAFAQKLEGRGGIVAACIGDGTLGEGVVYETLNIAAKWRLPLLVLLENNLYAQSTSQAETLAGDICARAAAFGLPTFHADTWNHDVLAGVLPRAVAHVRSGAGPAFVRVDTFRLAAHSKGDDDRDPAEIAHYASRDPVNRFVESARGAADSRLGVMQERVQRALERAAAAHGLATSVPAAPREHPHARLQAVELPGGTQLEALNHALRDWLSADPRVILIGEDIRSPYGGAFKVTRGLSDAFPDRVINTPISEAAIVGVGNGLALAGWRPVVEIMFGDFLTLCCDQILNHAAKFRGMYNGKVRNALVVRTPMGGGRGYGPTHSQNLEKHFVGVPGLSVLVLHARTRISEMYRHLREIEHPVLVIENKLLYRERCDAALIPGYSACESADRRFPTTVLRRDAPGDVTIVAFGRMSALAERAAARLAGEEEVYADLVFPLQVWPLDVQPIVDSVARTGKLLVVEEGAAGYDLASEVVTQVVVRLQGTRALNVRRLAAQPVPIPSATHLENQVLPGADDIVRLSLELFDA